MPDIVERQKYTTTVYTLTHTHKNNSKKILMKLNFNPATMNEWPQHQYKLQVNIRDDDDYDDNDDDENDKHMETKHK